MKPLPPASVIVTSYNDLEILPATLAALACQSDSNFEVVIADDGSHEDYAALLREWAPRFAHGIHHVWHDDQGFRRARILNRGILVSRFDRVIFMDADCLPHRRFVENHVKYVAAGVGITGRRTHIKREAIHTPQEILARGLGLSPARLLSLWLGGKARVIEHGFVSPILHEASNNALLGSNHSVWRDDILKVNGYDEKYVGYGWEDCDFEQRLLRAGVVFRNLRNKVVQYHVMHAQRTEKDERNKRLFERAKAAANFRTLHGMAEIQPSDFRHVHYECEMDTHA
jgi:glycosyltransferase involved in cell wall biosynthesis